MSWVDGARLVDETSNTSKSEDLLLVEQGIKCTLSQLLETGLLHADPHAGNILKTAGAGGAGLAYLDFGLVARVPLGVALLYVIFMTPFTGLYSHVCRR